MLFSVTDVLIIVATVLAIDFAWSISWSKYNAHLDKSRRIDAAAVLRKNNLTKHLYIACIGTTDDELHKALNFFGDRGHIIMNSNMQIVGEVASAQASIHAVVPAVKSPALRPSFLKLVVDNTEI